MKEQSHQPSTVQLRKSLGLSPSFIITASIYGLKDGKVRNAYRLEAVSKAPVYVLWTEETEEMEVSKKDFLDFVSQELQRP